jgi:hypothetical protein
MDELSLLQEFEDLAERLSIKVRYAHLDHAGGLCRYRGTYHIIINRRLDMKERIAVMGQALAQVPLDEVFLIPALREAIERYREPPPRDQPASGAADPASEDGENP